MSVIKMELSDLRIIITFLVDIELLFWILVDKSGFITRNFE